MVQVAAPERPIDGGMATEALLAQVLVGKYAARRSGWDWPDNQDDGQGWCRNAGRA